MAGKCKSCAHLRRNEIDRDLVAGVPLRNIAAEYGISHVALGRHLKNGHITKQMQEQFHAEGLIEREEITVQIKDLQRLLHAFLRKANEEGDLKEVLMLSKEIRGLIELLGKLLGRFPKEPEINILVNPVWLSLKQEIFQALKPFPDAKTAVYAAVADAQTLSSVQRKMIAGELDYKDVSPAVLAIINREFEKEPEHRPMTPAVKEVCDHIMGHDSEEQDLERLPEIAYAKEKAKKPKGWKLKDSKSAVEAKICYRCIVAHSFHGKYWSIGQVWDSSDPDGPQPPVDDYRWELHNPAEKTSGLLPTKRRG